MWRDPTTYIDRMDKCDIQCAYLAGIQANAIT